jgi:serine/threonine protein kinase
VNASITHGGSTLADFDAQARREIGERFAIEGILRHGPQSLVYRVQTSQGEALALKIIPRHRVEGFSLAAVAARAMEHPHVVSVLEHGETRQFFWYTMPLIAGRSLDRVLAEDGPFQLKPCLLILEQIASALQYGHRRGVVHGNLKTENVLVRSDGWALVTDFGMPAARDRLPEQQAGERLLAYTAPEMVARSGRLPASDQYALAVLVHECLTGLLPPSPESPEELPPNPRVAMPRSSRPRSRLPEQVLPALRRAMATAPGERFPTVLSFVATLDTGPQPQAAAVSSFAPEAPHKKSEPIVLTMEPERHRARRVLWVAVLAICVGAGVAAPRLLRTDRGQQLADRFEGWYQPDVPPGGIVLQPPVSSTPAPSRPAPVPTAPARTDSPAATAPRPAAPTQAQPRPVARAPVSRPPTAAPRPVEPPPPPPAAAGKLIISSVPWGTVYLDGRPVGNTPMTGEVPAGGHTIRIMREGFAPFERFINVAPGEAVRLTGIELQEASR